MKWWNAGNGSAQNSKLSAAEAEARRLYDGVRWLRGSRTRSELTSEVMPFLRNSKEILPRLRLSEAVPCLKEIYLKPKRNIVANGTMKYLIADWLRRQTE